jgi:putative transcriptional regulator
MTDLSTQDYTTQMPPELLLDYATGATPEAVSLAIATYLDMNPAAAKCYFALNAVGGTLLDDIAPSAMADSSLSAILQRLDRVAVDPKPPVFSGSDDCRVPHPLRPYIGHSWDTLHWKSVTSGVEEYVISTTAHGWRTSLLRIAPGKAMPTHTHAGEEYTIVLDGAYTDAAGSFARGSIEIADSGVTHKPLSDPVTGCVCLAVLSAPVQLTGVIGWLVNPFLRH